MNQLQERSMTPQSYGIRKGLELLKEKERTPPKASPKEVFLRKEKSLRLKMVLIFSINNLIWIIIFLFPEQSSTSPKSLPLEQHHEIVKLPAQIFSEEPTSTKKIHVILKHSKSAFQTSGYLRLVESDAYGETGHKATIEIPKEDLQKLNSLTSFWLLYPYFKKERSKTIQKRTIREVIF